MPTNAELYNLAVRYHQSGNLAGAESLYRQVLLADPAHAGSLHLLGLLAHQTGQHQAAIGLFRRAISLNSKVADFHYNLGIALVVQGNLAEAIACFRQALQINPNDAFAHYNLGHALFWQGELEIAIDCFRQAVRLDPNNVEALVDQGSSLLWQGQLAEVEKCIRQALDIKPGHEKALWHHAWLRLLQGDFTGGWPDYEHRPALTGPGARTFQQPRWDGTALEGKTILVYAEQGLGDTIQFARYLPQFQHQGAKVIFECQPSLVTLLSKIPGVDQLVAAGMPVPPFDVQIALLSLPLLFGTTLATIPANVPYLAADQQRVLHWRREINGDVDSGLNIGIAWQGSMNQQTQKGDRRSLPLHHFSVLARLPGVRLFSLQIGPGTQQLAQAPFPITDLGSRFDPNSLDDLAAALVNVDLVITVDSAVAHLAGALGLPVWTLLSFSADWRWLLERTDSPWYPTMRLFRQSRLGYWDDVMERVVAAIKDKVKGSRDPGSTNLG